jgi:hypothetical protein
MGAARLGLEVMASAKCLAARPGHDGDPLIGIAGECLEGVVQLEMCIGVERIHDFRTRQRHDGDRSLPLNRNMLGHSLCPSFGIGPEH